jgi:membrane fusion protein, macrolide-specific efflux system
MSAQDNPPKSPTMAQRAAGEKRGRRVSALVLLLVIAPIAWFAYGAWFGEEPTEQYILAAIERGDVEDAVTATGTLQPRDYVDVGTQVSGQLKIVHVKIGEHVKQGQLLAQIDPTVLQSRVDSGNAQLQNQQAQLADKRAQLALAELQLRRQRNMMKEEATTTEALQEADANVQSLKAQIAAVQAQMKQTGATLRGDTANLGYTKIYAPMSGTVVTQIAKQGQTLNASQQAPVIVRIADLSTMTVQTQVSEADVSRLRLGMKAYFTTLGGQGKRWHGKLRQINPTPATQNNVVLYDALFDVPNRDGALMTQMTAQVFFIIGEAKDTIVAPVGALSPMPKVEKTAAEKAADAQKAAEENAAAEKAAEAERLAADKAEAERIAAEKVAADKVAAETVVAETAGAGKGKRGKGGKRSGEKGAREKSAVEKSVEQKVAEDKVVGEKTESAPQTESKPRDKREGRGVRSGGTAMVKVVKPDGKIEERQVKIGVMNRVYAQITEGLEVGEQVVAGIKQPEDIERLPIGTNRDPNAVGMRPRL